MPIKIPDMKYFEERRHSMLLTLLHLSVPTASLQLTADADADPSYDVTQLQ
jgi:hypothetical protein